MRTKFLFLIFGAGIFLTSCEKEDVSIEKDISQLDMEKEISKKDLQTISELHFNTKEIEVIDFLLPDGSFE